MDTITFGELGGLDGDTHGDELASQMHASQMHASQLEARLEAERLHFRSHGTAPATVPSALETAPATGPSLTRHAGLPRPSQHRSLAPSPASWHGRCAQDAPWWGFEEQSSPGRRLEARSAALLWSPWARSRHGRLHPRWNWHGCPAQLVARQGHPPPCASHSLLQAFRTWSAGQSLQSRPEQSFQRSAELLAFHDAESQRQIGDQLGHLPPQLPKHTEQPDMLPL